MWILIVLKIYTESFGNVSYAGSFPTEDECKKEADTLILKDYHAQGRIDQKTRYQCLKIENNP